MRVIYLRTIWGLSPSSVASRLEAERVNSDSIKRAGRSTKTLATFDRLYGHHEWNQCGENDA